ncbi:hypothetical protein CHUAL_010987 [Chamberlinius hualienensis]
MNTHVRYKILFAISSVIVILTIIFYFSTTFKYAIARSKQNVISKVVQKLSNKKWQMFTDDKIARKLQKTIRVLCWIAVTKSSYEKAMIINQTWGQRCTKILFIGDKTTTNISGIVSLDVPDGRLKLWSKTKEAFKYIFENHIEEADWFLKADTDTYVIMENLRYLLSTQTPNKPQYVGCIIRLFYSEGYNSGGAGYLLNRLALKKLVSRGYNNKRCYAANSFAEIGEDVSLGYCMALIKIPPSVTTDERGKNRFFPFEPYDHVSSDPPRNNRWYWAFSHSPGEKSFNCCSETMVSFHYVPKNVMLTMELMLYHSKVFGVSHNYLGDEHQQNA